MRPVLQLAISKHLDNELIPFLDVEVLLYGSHHKA